MILVTGSSGYVGTRLYELLSDKFDFIGLDRKAGIYDQFIKCDLNNESLDINMSNFLTSKNIKISKVIHLAAARIDRTAKKSIYYNDNINATKNFLNNSNLKDIKKFINVSSVAAIDGKHIDVSSVDLSDDDLYRLTKYKQERIVKDWCKKNNISLVNFMPSAIYSKKQPSNTNTFKLAKIAKYSPIVFSTNAKKSLTELDNFIMNISKQIESTEEGNVLAIEKPVITVDQIVSIITEARIMPFLKIRISKRLMLRIAQKWELLFIYTTFDPFISANRVEKYLSETEYKSVECNLKYQLVKSIESSIQRNML